MGRRVSFVVASALVLGLFACSGGDDVDTVPGSATPATGGTSAPPVTVTTVAPSTTAVDPDPTVATTSTSVTEANNQPRDGEERTIFTDRLAVQPVAGGVYLLGNSMFATGVDLEAMQAGIPERDVRFNYYDGHYTSLWYLIAETALGPSEERPELVVWGFRPRYAMIPAFRQNRENSTDLFAFPDAEYERLTGDAVENGDFLSGPIVDFGGGFIPLTAESFQKSSSPQLVVIWRPVTVAQGAPDPNEVQFVDDAIAFFEAEGIPHVDFFHDEELDEAKYGKGDHYNADGMHYVTETLIEEIREMLSL